MSQPLKRLCKNGLVKVSGRESAGIAFSFARETLFGGDTKSWDVLLGSLFGVAINPWLKLGKRFHLESVLI